MNEQEKRIKEQREIEASRKGLLGLGGKFGLIVRFLGTPIMGDNFTMYESSHIELNPYDDPENIQEKIPYMDSIDEPTGYGWKENRNIEDIIHVGDEILGWHFDGLSRAVHIEIRYLESEKELKVQYQGRTVYQEIAGNLCAYVPEKDWENSIDKLYEIARITEKRTNKSIRKEELEEAEGNKKTWFERITARWGKI